MSCLLNVYQPFMKIWVHKDELIFDYPAVICFSVYFFIVEINTLLNNYKDAAGIWHEDRFRPLVTAGVNLALNLIMVQFWGVYGVLLSTVMVKYETYVIWWFVEITEYEKRIRQRDRVHKSWISVLF